MPDFIKLKELIQQIKQETEALRNLSGPQFEEAVGTYLYHTMGPSTEFFQPSGTHSINVGDEIIKIDGKALKKQEPQFFIKMDNDYVAEYDQQMEKLAALYAELYKELPEAESLIQSRRSLQVVISETLRTVQDKINEFKASNDFKTNAATKNLVNELETIFVALTKEYQETYKQHDQASKNYSHLEKESSAPATILKKSHGSWQKKMSELYHGGDFIAVPGIKALFTGPAASLTKLINAFKLGGPLRLSGSAYLTLMLMNNAFIGPLYYKFILRLVGVDFSKKNHLPSLLKSLKNTPYGFNYNGELVQEHALTPQEKAAVKKVYQIKKQQMIENQEQKIQQAKMLEVVAKIHVLGNELKKGMPVSLDPDFIKIIAPTPIGEETVSIKSTSDQTEKPKFSVVRHAEETVVPNHQPVETTETAKIVAPASTDQIKDLSKLRQLVYQIQQKDKQIQEMGYVSTQGLEKCSESTIVQHLEQEFTKAVKDGTDFNSLSDEAKVSLKMTWFLSEFKKKSDKILNEKQILLAELVKELEPHTQELIEKHTGHKDFPTKNQAQAALEKSVTELIKSIRKDAKDILGDLSVAELKKYIRGERQELFATPKSKQIKEKWANTPAELQPFTPAIFWEIRAKLRSLVESLPYAISPFKHTLNGAITDIDRQKLIQSTHRKIAFYSFFLSPEKLTPRKFAPIRRFLKFWVSGWLRVDPETEVTRLRKFVFELEHNRNPYVFDHYTKLAEFLIMENDVKTIEKHGSTAIIDRKMQKWMTENTPRPDWIEKIMPQVEAKLRKSEPGAIFTDRLKGSQVVVDDIKQSTTLARINELIDIIKQYKTLNAVDPAVLFQEIKTTLIQNDLSYIPDSEIEYFIKLVTSTDAIESLNHELNNYVAKSGTSPAASKKTIDTIITEAQRKMKDVDQSDGGKNDPYKDLVNRRLDYVQDKLQKTYDAYIDHEVKKKEYEVLQNYYDKEIGRIEKKIDTNITDIEKKVKQLFAQKISDLSMKSAFFRFFQDRWVALKVPKKLADVVFSAFTMPIAIYRSILERWVGFKGPQDASFTELVRFTFDFTRSLFKGLEGNIRHIKTQYLIQTQPDFDLFSLAERNAILDPNYPVENLNNPGVRKQESLLSKTRKLFAKDPIQPVHGAASKWEEIFGQPTQPSQQNQDEELKQSNEKRNQRILKLREELENLPEVQKLREKANNVGITFKNRIAKVKSVITEDNIVDLGTGYISKPEENGWKPEDLKNVRKLYNIVRSPEDGRYYFKPILDEIYNDHLDTLNRVKDTAVKDQNRGVPHASAIIDRIDHKINQVEAWKRTVDQQIVDASKETIPGQTKPIETTKSVFELTKKAQENRRYATTSELTQKEDLTKKLTDLKAIRQAGQTEHNPHEVALALAKAEALTAAEEVTAFAGRYGITDKNAASLVKTVTPTTTDLPSQPISIIEDPTTVAPQKSFLKKIAEAPKLFFRGLVEDFKNEFSWVSSAEKEKAKKSSSIFAIRPDVFRKEKEAPVTEVKPTPKSVSEPETQAKIVQLRPVSTTVETSAIQTKPSPVVAENKPDEKITPSVQKPNVDHKEMMLDFVADNPSFKLVDLQNHFAAKGIQMDMPALLNLCYQARDIIPAYDIARQVVDYYFASLKNNPAIMVEDFCKGFGISDPKILQEIRQTIVQKLVAKIEAFAPNKSSLNLAELQKHLASQNIHMDKGQLGNLCNQAGYNVSADIATTAEAADFYLVQTKNNKPSVTELTEFFIKLGITDNKFIDGIQKELQKRHYISLIEFFKNPDIRNQINCLIKGEPYFASLTEAQQYMALVKEKEQEFLTKNNISSKDYKYNTQTHEKFKADYGIDSLKLERASWIVETKGQVLKSDFNHLINDLEPESLLREAHQDLVDLDVLKRLEAIKNFYEQNWDSAAKTVKPIDTQTIDGFEPTSFEKSKKLDKPAARIKQPSPLEVYEVLKAKIEKLIDGGKASQKQSDILNSCLNALKRNFKSAWLYDSLAYEPFDSKERFKFLNEVKQVVSKITFKIWVLDTVKSFIPGLKKNKADTTLSQNTNLPVQDRSIPSIPIEKLMGMVEDFRRAEFFDKRPYRPEKGSTSIGPDVIALVGAGIIKDPQEIGLTQNEFATIYKEYNLVQGEDGCHYFQALLDELKQTPKVQALQSNPTPTIVGPRIVPDLQIDSLVDLAEYFREISAFGEDLPKLSGTIDANLIALLGAGVITPEQAGLTPDEFKTICQKYNLVPHSEKGRFQFPQIRDMKQNVPAADFNDDTKRLPAVDLEQIAQERQKMASQPKLDLSTLKGLQGHLAMIMAVVQGGLTLDSLSPELQQIAKSLLASGYNVADISQALIDAGKPQKSETKPVKPVNYDALIEAQTKTIEQLEAQKETLLKDPDDKGKKLLVDSLEDSITAALTEKARLEVAKAKARVKQAPAPQENKDSGDNNISPSVAMDDNQKTDIGKVIFPTNIAPTKAVVAPQPPQGPWEFVNKANAIIEQVLGPKVVAFIDDVILGINDPQGPFDRKDAFDVLIEKGSAQWAHEKKVATRFVQNTKNLGFSLVRGTRAAITPPPFSVKTYGGGIIQSICTNGQGSIFLSLLGAKVAPEMTAKFSKVIENVAPAIDTVLGDTYSRTAKITGGQGFKETSTMVRQYYSVVARQYAASLPPQFRSPVIVGGTIAATVLATGYATYKVLSPYVPGLGEENSFALSQISPTEIINIPSAPEYDFSDQATVNLYQQRQAEIQQIEQEVAQLQQETEDHFNFLMWKYDNFDPQKADEYQIKSKLIHSLYHLKTDDIRAHWHTKRDLVNKAKNKLDGRREQLARAMEPHKITIPDLLVGDAYICSTEGEVEAFKLRARELIHLYEDYIAHKGLNQFDPWGTIKTPSQATLKLMQQPGWDLSTSKDAQTKYNRFQEAMLKMMRTIYPHRDKDTDEELLAYGRNKTIVLHTKDERFYLALESMVAYSKKHPKPDSYANEQEFVWQLEKLDRLKKPCAEDQAALQACYDNFMTVNKKDYDQAEAKAAQSKQAYETQAQRILANVFYLTASQGPDIPVYGYDKIYNLSWQEEKGVKYLKVEIKPNAPKSSQDQELSTKAMAVYNPAWGKAVDTAQKQQKLTLNLDAAQKSVDTILSTAPMVKPLKTLNQATRIVNGLLAWK